jgi:hypothetical protein
MQTMELQTMEPINEFIKAFFRKLVGKPGTEYMPHSTSTKNELEKSLEVLL